MTPSLPVDLKDALPEDEVDFDNIFILYYRQGTNVFPLTKFFHFKGSLKQAMDRGRQHCDAITGRFLRVEPFLHNLTEDEINRSKE